MKIFILVSLLAVSANAQIYFKNVPLCTSWNFSSAGYLCSSYPMQEAIPDQFSLNNKINNLEARIQALEKKLAQYEY
jgi:hypothetical protein